MLGAIIGDIVGSTREFNNIKTTQFELLPQGSFFTDASILPLAVAEWLLTVPSHSPSSRVRLMQTLGRRHPDGGYGGMFSRWLVSPDPQPYGSYGNGSGMRVSPAGLYAATFEEALRLAEVSSSVTHNHPEGIKGAKAIAGSVFIKAHAPNDEEAAKQIAAFVTRDLHYDISPSLDSLRPTYSFDETCQGSVPIALMAYLQSEGHSLENTLRLAVSMGGDTDTIACMACAIAGAGKGGTATMSPTMSEVADKCRTLLTPDLLDILDRFEAHIAALHA